MKAWISREFQRRGGKKKHGAASATARVSGLTTRMPPVKLSESIARSKIVKLSVGVRITGEKYLSDIMKADICTKFWKMIPRLSKRPRRNLKHHKRGDVKAKSYALHAEGFEKKASCCRKGHSHE
jgi:hypothetical protein